MRTLVSLLTLLSVPLWGASRAQAYQATLTSDRELYTASGLDPVVVTLFNSGSTTLTCNPAPSVWKGSQLVAAPVTIAMLDWLEPGKTKSWTWNKKDSSGKAVAPGSYTVKWQVGSAFASKTVTLTQVTLSTDRAVYTKTGTSDPVVVTLKNTGSTAVIVYPSPSVWKGSQVVHAGLTIEIASSLAPGQSISWTWNKKTTAGSSVASGSYTLKWTTSQGTGLTLTRDVAVCSYAQVAGTSRFPLYAGNEWLYTDASGNMKVTKKDTYSSYYYVTNLLGSARWAQLYGSTYPVLYVEDGDDEAAAAFFFNKYVGYTYSPEVGVFSPGTKLKVASTSETVVTPMGKFTGCYRIENVGPITGLNDYTSFSFAKGVGLVQFKRGGITYQLRYAKLKGSDGQWYTVGQK